MDSRLRDALRELTTERLAFIRKVLRSGLGKYNEYPPSLRRDHNARVEANIRNCHIVAEAERMCLERTDIRVAVERGRVFFIIADRLKLSFKKLNGRLRSNNIPTQAALAFNAQQMPLAVDLPPSLVNIIAGYTVDRIGIADSMYVTVPNGRQNLAAYPLGTVAEVAEIINFPERSEGDVAPIRKSGRVKARKGAERKLESNEPQA